MFRTCLEILEVLFGFQVAWVTTQRKNHFKKTTDRSNVFHPQ
jgi:hypothetical protein